MDLTLDGLRARPYEEIERRTRMGLALVIAFLIAVSIGSRFRDTMVGSRADF
jgi:hypothetical protein